MASFFKYVQHNNLLRHDPSDVYATRVTSLKGLLTHLILEWMNQGCFGLNLDKKIKKDMPGGGVFSAENTGDELVTSCMPCKCIVHPKTLMIFVLCKYSDRL
jgi:hypothetical protein